MNCDRPSPSNLQTWPTFLEMLRRLHGAGLYLHPHQLAEFLVRHGLPVDLCYVPVHLRQRASKINTHYQGDLARLETIAEPNASYLEEQLFVGTIKR